MTRRQVPLALACLLLLAAAVPASADPTTRRDADPSARAIIGFAGELPAALPGLDIVRTSPQGGWIAVEAPSMGLVKATAAGLPGVLYVEPDELHHTRVVPDDPRYGSQYGPPMMGAEAAWDAAGFGDTSVTVAVLDTGLRHGHEDLTPTSRFSPTQVYTGNASDNCGHGTHVAGTVAATTGNGRGVAGMSQAHVQPYKVLEATGGLLTVQCSGSTSAIAQAVYDATDAGADIISMSLGGGGFSTTFNDAVNYAWGNGVLVVAASGNDGGNNSVDYPAAYDNAIAVGALDSDKGRASYSDGGPQLDVVAPGSSVVSTYNGSTTSYSSASGTSMATPHVAGALALAWSCAPAGTTNADLRQALEATAEDLGAVGRDDAYGHGLARADLLVAAVCGGTTTEPEPEPDPEPEPEPEPDPTDDPDPATPTLTSGESVSVTLDGTGDEAFYKIAVPADATSTTVSIDGPSCGLFGCSIDADLYTRDGSRPTDAQWSCRPFASGSDETCTDTTPTAGWLYVRVDSYSGSGTVTLTARVS